MKHRSIGLWKGAALVALCGGVLLSATSSSFAQQQPGAGGGQGRRGGFGGGFGGGQGRRGGFGQPNIANVPAAFLQEQLKLTPDQTTKIAAIQAQLEKDSTAVEPAPPAQGQQFDRDAFMASMQKVQALRDKAKTDVEAVLTADQKAKEEDVFKVASAFTSTGLPIQTYGDLKLTDAQKKSLTEIAGGAQKSYTALRDQAQDGGQTDLRAAYQKLMDDTKAKSLAVLTDAQKKIVADYEKAHPQRGFSGRGGFGGPGGGGRGGFGGGRRGGGQAGGGQAGTL